MDFVRSYFIRFSCNQNIEETLFFTLSACLSNVLITRESNFDEKSVHLLRGLFVIEVTSYKIHTLKLRQYVHKKIRLDSASVRNS